MKKHFNLVMQLSIVSFLLASCGEDNTKTQGNTPNMSALSIEGFVAKTSQINDFMEAAGTVVAGEEVQIAPEISGKIINLPSKEGQFVNKGDLLVKLFDSDLQSQKQRTTAQLQLARETVKRLQP
ncbi:MAG: biotin/lipoyl-binding protein [Flavobacteriales bacterium]